MFPLIARSHAEYRGKRRLSEGNRRRSQVRGRRYSQNSDNGSGLRPGAVALNRTAGSPVVILILVSMLIGLGVPRPISAQVLYGSVTGNVTDQNGAVVVGAKVEVLNVGTNISKTATTDERGGYQVSDLQPGIYKITISAASFRTVEQTDVRVEANTVRRVDMQLLAASVSESVTVSAQSEPLQTDRADLNETQTSREINNLPLFGSVGRNYQTLIELIPGTSRSMGFVSNGSGEENSAAGNPQRSISYNVNGVSRLQNNTRIDGASVVYPWLPTNTVYVPPAESIQEVNIVTNSFNAEQGLAGGAAINVIVKTGTNDIHGSGWFYDTNSATAARNAFTSPTAAVPVPKNIL